MKKNLILVLQAIIFVCLSVYSFAQETTATLSGQVKDSKGALISGVTVVVKHIPTGATTSTQTNNKGSYYVSNLQSGGPYQVTFSHVGLKWQDHVELDSRYVRPTEVDALICDPSKAERELKWKAKTHWKGLAELMVDADIELVKAKK